MLIHAETVQKVWPEWRLEKLIGKGSYGYVYQAVREELGITTRTAVKVIPVPQDSSETESLRLEGMSEEEMFALLASDGMLVKRPLLVTDDTVLVGFKQAEWEATLLG